MSSDGGGWSNCATSMTGTTFGVYDTESYLNFWEVMAYSQEAIQINAGATVSVIGTEISPAYNAL